MAITSIPSESDRITVAVEAVRWYLDGGCRAVTLAELADQRGVDNTDLLAVMRTTFHLADRNPDPAPMVVPERYR